MSDNSSRKPSRWFYCTLGATIAGYVLMSVFTGSFVFWNWRKLKFDDFELVSFTQGWGTLKQDRNLDGGAIVLKGVRYSRGLATHANSEIHIKLKGHHTYFSGKCGYPDHKSSAKIECSVKGKNKVLFTSSPLDSSSREAAFRVDTQGETDLTLVVRSLEDNIDYAHAVWVDLRTSD
jgi:hypothetical protein